MNLLYISHLSGAKYVGPTYSVPSQIRAQSLYDHVFWFNAVNEKVEIFSKISFYHDSREYSGNTISCFPKPFDSPDLTIVEEIYVYHNPKILLELRRKKLPYIIIPRSQLTWQAQQRKRLKKQIGNILFFRRIVRNAMAIQYLTIQEKNDSIKQWEKENFIVPNGINVCGLVKASFHKNKIDAVYIGRLEPYQKGLDLLISACGKIQADLRQKNFLLTLYGTSIQSDIRQIENMISVLEINDIVHIENAVFDREKRDVLLEADLFIMASRFEGQPMGLLEALSYGLPCIVTQGTNMREEIEAYGAGWTAECEVESIVAAMQMMLTETTYLNEKGQHAYELSLKYDWNRLAEQLHRIYMDLLLKRRKT